MNINRSALPRAFLAAVLAFALAGPSLAQSIRTVAGGGSDDGRSATAVPLFGPHGVTLDQGTLLIVSRGDNLVRRVDLTSGAITTVAGNGGEGFGGDGRGALFAALNNPAHLAVDSSRNIYIADTGNGRIRRVDAASGIITTFAGGGEPADGRGDGLPATEARLVAPFGLLLDRGFLYVSDGGFEANHIRRIDLASGIITTIAGTGPGGFAGDGGPAINAQLSEPRGIAADAAGNLYVAEIGNDRVRRIDFQSGIITTIAGGGSIEGDGVPATQARLTYVSATAFDPAGNLLIAADGGIRRVHRETQIITTVAAGLILPFAIAVDANGVIYAPDLDRSVIERFMPGNPDGTIVAGGGTYRGDGLLATSAILRNPQGVAVGPDGSFYIADQAHSIVRRVNPEGVISTFAGSGGAYTEDHEGMPATEAAIGFPDDVAVNAAGNIVLIADHLNGRVWKVEGGIVTRFAGGGFPADGVGDGGPARSAAIDPWGVSFDAQGNAYIADRSRNRIRKVSPDGTITTVAGSGPADGEGGYTGDGGPATSALLRQPLKAVVAPNGILYISDAGNGVIRRVVGGTISTWAGHPNDGETLIDDVLATEASLDPQRIAVDAQGNLFIADNAFHRVRRVDAATQIITTVAGSSTWYLDPGFSGDNGPARDAKLNLQYETSGVAVDSRGNVLVSDTLNNRVRMISGCVAVTAPALIAPAAGEAGLPIAPTLEWTPVQGAFRYDVYLSTSSPANTLVAADLDVPSVTLANLAPATAYRWRVVAKGDPFCDPLSSATSAERSFTTAEGCSAPAPFATLAPPNLALGVPSTVTLQWESSEGATYDLYFGITSPPPLVATGLTDASHVVSGLVGATYAWTVVAHAECDPSRTTSTPQSIFTVAAVCGAAGAFDLVSPAQSANVRVDVLFSWTASAGTTGYDLYLGTSPNPPLFRAGLQGTSTLVTGLEPGLTWSWKVIANACLADGARISAISTFTTAAACPTPEPTSFVSVPASTVAAGTTYVVTWSEAAGLDAGGGYLIERARDAGFSSGVEVQSTSSTSASFFAALPGTYYHRVRAVAACNPLVPGPFSSSRAVSAGRGAPNVVFSTLPEAVITNLGEPLEQKKTEIAIENLGSEPVQILVGRNELASVPFFTIVDPAGGDAFLTLQPRTPKVLELRFSGPPNDVAGSYQGIVFAASLGEGLRVTPYAFVNLKVGGRPGAAPQFVSGGAPVEYVAFPPWDGDDASRPPVEIEIRNPGTGPMELAAEIGPEIWLRPEPGWNTTPIPAGATRRVQLFTQRIRALNGSALPRYTFFTVRTRDGGSARLLVQDDSVPRASGERIVLEPEEESRIVPQVVSATTGGGVPLFSIVRLSNEGNEPVQVELVATPGAADGFDRQAVRARSVLVPANDVVVLTDPLRQLFGLTPPAFAQIEVRAAEGRVGSVNVSSSVARSAADQRGGYEVPIFERGEGARLGRSVIVRGARSGAGAKTTLVLVETSGRDQASARVELRSAEGSIVGQTVVSIPRYGRREIADVGATLAGGAAFDAASLRVTTESGGGVVSAIAVLVQRADEQGAAIAAIPELLATEAESSGGSGTTPVTSTLVSVISGPLPGVTGGPAYDTILGLVAPASADAVFSLAYHGLGLVVTPRSTLPVGAGRTVEIPDAVRTLFALSAPSSGRIVVTGPPGGVLYGMLATRGASGASAISTAIPVVTSTMQNLTGGTAGLQKPLYLDGIDQSLEPATGNRWMLLLNEIGGEGGGVVTVRLYEAGNRSLPIAERDVSIGANQELRLDTLFAELGLEVPERRKARANMLCSVEAKSGRIRVAATGLAIDRATGRAKSMAFVPTGGPVPVSSTLLTSVPTEPTGRKRVVRRP